MFIDSCRTTGEFLNNFADSILVLRESGIWLSSCKFQCIFLDFRKNSRKMFIFLKLLRGIVSNIYLSNDSIQKNTIETNLYTKKTINGEYGCVAFVSFVSITLLVTLVCLMDTYTWKWYVILSIYWISCQDMRCV